MTFVCVEKLRQWIVDHDDRLSFILCYVGGAVFLSVFLNLFWVACLMLSHLALEVWRHKVLEEDYPLLKALWCVKLDISLVLFALVVALYSDMIFGLLGIGQAARAARAVAGIEMLSRITVIERMIKVFFLTVDDMTRVTNLVIKGLRRRKAVALDGPKLHLEEHADTLDSGITKGDIFALSFGGLCLVLIAASAFILPEGLVDTARIILHELTP